MSPRDPPTPLGTLAFSDPTFPRIRELPGKPGRGPKGRAGSLGSPGAVDAYAPKGRHQKICASPSLPGNFPLKPGKPNKRCHRHSQRPGIVRTHHGPQFEEGKKGNAKMDWRENIATDLLQLAINCNALQDRLANRQPGGSTSPLPGAAFDVSPYLFRSRSHKHQRSAGVAPLFLAP